MMDEGFRLAIRHPLRVSVTRRRTKMFLSSQVRQEKLAKLLAAEGYDKLEDLAEAIFSDSVSPAICTDADCDYTSEMEPDQDAGYCESCGKNTVVSALVLAGLI
jgi:hypothetical protein